MAAQKREGGSSEPAAVFGSPDLARRVDSYCGQLGMTLEEAAKRAGMAPGYLRQIEQMGADFDVDALRRLAAVLGVPYQELVEGRTDVPQGQNPPAAHPRLAQLTTQECWQRLGRHGIGRIALPGSEGTLVLPVNYLVDGTDIVYRTARGGAADPDPGQDVTFEADQTSERRRDGWSVLVFGTANRLTDGDTIERYTRRSGAAPWAGGLRDQWIRIVSGRLTGRLIDAGS